MLPRYIPDTIAAIATPLGKGGIGIVRVSGPLARNIAQHMVAPSTLQPRKGMYTTFKDTQGQLIDQGLVLFFEGPASFTGEDVLELQGHGGPVVMDTLLHSLLAQDVRLARPGEFSERAFLNGKMDLTQAEAIADLINAQSQTAAQSALRSMQGAFSKQIHHINQQLKELRMWVEAGIDFSDQDIDFMAEQGIYSQLDTVIEAINQLIRTSTQGTLLQEGIHLVIAGPPNVGKSSLLNHLSQQDLAIVSDIPGTTRDPVNGHIHIDGLPIHLMDTAGLRATEDPIEQAGIQRAHSAMNTANLILYLLDDSKPHQPNLDDLPEVPIIFLHNKIDLTHTKPHVQDHHAYISLKNQEGLQAVVELIKKVVGYSGNQEGLFMARRRHLDALHRTQHALVTGKKQTVELLAEDLRLAHNALNEITGTYCTDDLLGDIFSHFCIGK